MEDRERPLDPEVARMRAIVEAVPAPASLRASIERERHRTAPRRALRRRFQVVGSLSAAAAAAGVVLALLVPGGAPSALEAAGLGARPALAAAPPVDPNVPGQLVASVAGVHFPTWGPKLRWVAEGARSDTLDGRATRTVFYESPSGVRLGYTIVSGKALGWPSDGKQVTERGVEIHLTRSGGRRVAVWRVNGHTCVISAPLAVPEARIISLASISTYG